MRFTRLKRRRASRWAVEPNRQCGKISGVTGMLRHSSLTWGRRRSERIRAAPKWETPGCMFAERWRNGDTETFSGCTGLLYVAERAVTMADLRSTTAIILAGGLGTRLRPVVSDRPKVLAEVAGRPFLAYLLEQVAAAGVRGSCCAPAIEPRPSRRRSAALLRGCTCFTPQRSSP